jgi:carbamoyl-phosphate synthase large subunit
VTGGSPSVRFADQSTVMVLGAGTPTGRMLMDALSPHVPVVGADAALHSRGQFLPSPERPARFCAGAEGRFVLDLLSAAIRDAVSLIIPTSDVELAVLSAHRKEFAHYGIDLLVERPETLDICLDRFQLMRHCSQQVKVPLTILLDGSPTRQQLLALGQPFGVVSRYHNTRQVELVMTDVNQLNGLPRDGSLIARQLVHGSDFTIEILSRPDGCVVAAVPQSRQCTVAGKVVPARTIANGDLQEFARQVAAGVGATRVISVMARIQDDGTISLVDVVPRFAETMALSIAAGVNMPLLAAAAVLGATLPDNLGFEEVEASHLSAVEPTIPTRPRVGAQPPATMSLTVPRVDRARRSLAIAGASTAI